MILQMHQLKRAIPPLEPKVWDGAPKAKAWASDHRGVLAAFTLEDEARRFHGEQVDISDCRARFFEAPNLKGLPRRVYPRWLCDARWRL